MIPVTYFTFSFLIFLLYSFFLWGFTLFMMWCCVSATVKCFNDFSHFLQIIWCARRLIFRQDAMATLLSFCVMLFGRLIFFCHGLLVISSRTEGQRWATRSLMRHAQPQLVSKTTPASSPTSCALSPRWVYCKHEQAVMLFRWAPVYWYLGSC